MKRNAIRSLVVMMITVMVFALTPVPVSAASKAPGKVKITSVKRTAAVSTTTNKTTLTIKWKKASKATKYIIYVKQGDEPWKEQTRLGKRYRKLILTGVPAGQIQIKIRALNKKKKGKYSKVKTMYIASPLNAQQYIDRVEPTVKYQKIYGGSISFSGNRMIVSYDVKDVFSDASEYNWSAPSADVKAKLVNTLNVDAHAKETADKFRRIFDVSCGIKNFSYTAKFVNNGNDIPGCSVTY